MAPSHSRQLLVWTFPTIAVLLSYLWFKRKRIGVRSDPGDINADRDETRLPLETATKATKGVETEKPVEIPQTSSTKTPAKKISRSLSGVETAPIDIIIPPELRAVKSNPVVISDEDLDFEIEKIKSMKNETFKKSRALNTSTDSDSTITSGKEGAVEITSPAIKEIVETPGKQLEILANKTERTSTPVKTVERKLDMGEKKVETVEKMAQDMVRVEQKLNNLKLGMSQSGKKKGKKGGGGGGNKGGKSVKVTSEQREELQRQRSSERDSANHSPADVMLASPSLSSISDNHSEGSNDSGKGGSDVATPPSSRTPAGDGSVTDDVTVVPTLYEFVIAQQLVGRLIGRHGCFVADIKEKTHAHILIKKHPINNKMKVCAIEGTQLEVDNALRMIRDKFPLKRYPEVTLEQVSFVQSIEPVPLVADHLYLKLIEGINNDTILSCIVTPRHFFLQQPTHPSFPNLNVLSGHLNRCYNEAEPPLLPKPITNNTVCVAQSVGLWYRAMVLTTDEETDISYVKFLDYGGYAYVNCSLLRQIRGDFLLLPFQAAECYLADIKPTGDAENWPREAYDHIAAMTSNRLIYTQIVSYADDGIPLVHCYIAAEPQNFTFLNEDLVNKGYAEWIPQQQVEEAAAAAPSGEIFEGAVGGIDQPQQQQQLTLY